MSSAKGNQGSGNAGAGRQVAIDETKKRAYLCPNSGPRSSSPARGAEEENTMEVFATEGMVTRSVTKRKFVNENQTLKGMLTLMEG